MAGWRRRAQKLTTSSLIRRMKYRIGTCSACQAVYKVPASFSHDTARCRSCGEAVQIGPVEEEEAPAAAAPAPRAKPAAPKPKASAPRPATKAPAKPVAPRRSPSPAAAKPAAPPKPAAPAKPGATGKPAAAAKPAPAPAPAPARARADVPAGLEEIKVDPNKKRTGPSMKEKILARKKAEAEAAQAAAAKAAAPKAPAARPAAKPAARPAAAKPAAAKPAAKPAPAKPAPAKPVAKPAAAKPAARGKRSGGGSKRRAAPAKKKSAVPALLGIGGLVIVAGGALFVFKDDIMPSEPDEVQAADATQVASEDGAATTPENDAAATPAEPAADEAPGDDAADPAAEDAPEPEPVSLLDDEPDPAEAADPGEPQISASQEALLDLTTLSTYDKVDDTTQEEWDEMNELMVTFLDEEAGAAGNRARNKLRDIGRKAFPVILNNLRTLDLETPLGRQSGMLSQRLLSEICGGINYGWRDAPEKTDAIFNAKVIRKWHSEWGNAENDVEYWIRMAKLNDEEADLLRAELGSSSSDAEEDDPFDLDF